MILIQISLLVWMVIVLPIASMAFPKPKESHGESIETVWEGGWELFRERVRFLLSEMRMAEKDGRTEDCSRAQDAIAGLGIFAFSFVFGELEKGHDDAIEVLRRVS